jgi:hypothetical protein
MGRSTLVEPLSLGGRLTLWRTEQGAAIIDGNEKAGRGQLGWARFGIKIIMPSSAVTQGGSIFFIFA